MMEIYTYLYYMYDGDRMKINELLEITEEKLLELGVENLDIENDTQKFLSLFNISGYSPLLTLTLDDRLKELKSKNHNFKEINEIRTGYSKKNPSGKGIDKVIIEGIDSIYELGFNCIFGLGVDGISDTLAHLILPELVDYTDEVVNKLAVENKLQPDICEIEIYNFDLKKYTKVKYSTFKNSKGQGTILIPSVYLADENEYNLTDTKIKSIFTKEAQGNFMNTFKGKDNFSIIDEDIASLFLTLNSKQPKNTAYSTVKKRIRLIVEYSKKYPTLIPIINETALKSETIDSRIAAELCPIK